MFEQSCTPSRQFYLFLYCLTFIYDYNAKVTTGFLLQPHNCEKISQGMQYQDSPTLRPWIISHYQFYQYFNALKQYLRIYEHRLEIY